MTTAVNICTPTASLSRPSSIKTLATTPRLDRDSTPASASAAVKLRSQSQIEEEVGSDRERNQQRYGHAEHSGKEQPAANG